ncbi:InlB B-repeat-containing protein, partial [Paenibacillus sp. MY03]|uniref:InlB B-repeat-containing protein n=1 Tax=Paenibacillus sp. MY03 TaxID=302980 RepID=UPI0015C5DCCB
VYTVSFESNGGSSLQPLSVGHGTALVEPEAPIFEGYTFGGWYADSELTEPYLFSAAVKGNVTLYAKWTTNV